MKFSTKTAALTAALALSAVPAFALPPQVPSSRGTAHIPDNQGTQRAPSNPGAPTNPGSQGTAQRSTTVAPQATGDTPATPGPGASVKSKGKAYGKYCADQSKKHVDGQTGTPFSHCVTALAKLASGQSSNPTTACKTVSKKHSGREHGTPFSRCVAAAAKLLKDQPQS
jgi:hypothetical protein